MIESSSSEEDAAKGKKAPDDESVSETGDEKRARLARQYITNIKAGIAKQRKVTAVEGEDGDDDDEASSEVRGRVVAGQRDDDVDEILARSAAAAKGGNAYQVGVQSLDFGQADDDGGDGGDDDDDGDAEVRSLVAKRLKDDEAARSDRLVHAVAKGVRVLDAGRLWLKGLKSPATCVAASNACVFAGCKQGTIMQWCAETGRRLHTYRGGVRGPVDGGGHVGAVLCLALSSDGKLLLSGGADCLVRLYDVEARQLLDTFSGHREPVTGVAFRRNTHQFYTTSVDRTVRVWDGDERLYMDTLFGHQAPVQALAAFSKERCVTVGSDRTLRVWKILQESQLVFRGHKASIDCLAMLDDSWFVTGSQDGALSFWNATRKRPHATIPHAHQTPLGNGGWLSACAALPLSDLVATGSCDGAVRLWRADRKQGRLAPATYKFSSATPVVRKAKLQKSAPEEDDEHSGEAAAKAELASILMPTSGYQAAMTASSIAADGFVNGLAFAPNGTFIAAALSREHRLGRWSTVPHANEGVLLTRLRLPRQLQSPATDDDLLFGRADDEPVADSDEDDEEDSRE